MKNNTKKKNTVIFILFCLVLGMLLGWVGRDFYGSGIAGAVISNMGIWVFISALIAVYTQEAGRAAVHVFVFFAGVIGAFYAHTALLGGEISGTALMYWLVLALIGAAVGFLDWHSRDKEWMGAVCASVPISILLAEAFPIYHTRSYSLYFDIACAIALYVLMLDGKVKRLMAIPFVLVFTIALVYFDVLPNIAGLVV